MVLRVVMVAGGRMLGVGSVVGVMVVGNKEGTLGNKEGMEATVVEVWATKRESTPCCGRTVMAISPEDWCLPDICNA
jgi:hypothetical protein